MSKRQLKVTQIDKNFFFKLHELLTEHDDRNNFFVAYSKYIYDYDDSLLPIWDDRRYSFGQVIERLENIGLLNSSQVMWQSLVKSISQLVSDWEINNSIYEVLRESQFLVRVMDKNALPRFLKKLIEWETVDNADVIEMLEKTFQFYAYRLRTDISLHECTSMEAIGISSLKERLAQSKNALPLKNYVLYEKSVVGLYILSKRLQIDPVFLNIDDISKTINSPSLSRISELCENLNLLSILDRDETDDGVIEYTGNTLSNYDTSSAWPSGEPTLVENLKRLRESSNFDR